MRITDHSGKKLDYVYLALSDDEASELIDALRDLLSASEEKGFHIHINDASYKKEVTVYREDDETMVF